MTDTPQQQQQQNDLNPNELKRGTKIINGVKIKAPKNRIPRFDFDLNASTDSFTLNDPTKVKKSRGHSSLRA